jgi:hypothetical protein
MTQQDIRELAKQGNPKALAILINQSLKPKDITAKVGVKNDCLQILLESAEVPDQEAMISFIRNGLIKLEVSINNIKVYGRQIGEENPAWNQTFELIPVQDTPMIPEEIDEPIFPDTPPLNEMENSVFSASNIRQTRAENLPIDTTKPQNPSPRQSSEPLSVGNVVSAALRIYRDKFKLYWKLAFIGYLWVLVPVYGWAKFSAISALISRLAYSEVIERPETVEEARRHVMPKMWSFLGAGILVSLIVTVITFGAIFIFSFLGGVLAAILGQNTTAIIVLVLLGIVAFIAFLIGYIRLLSRLFVVEMPLAMEDSVTATSTISRSLQLTKGFAGRLQWIIAVAFLISLPISIVIISIVIQIMSFILKAVLSALFASDFTIFGFLYFLPLIVLSFASGSLLIPFWQAIKAVIYYDLRSRREGLGLQLRDAR